MSPGWDSKNWRILRLEAETVHLPKKNFAFTPQLLLGRQRFAVPNECSFFPTFTKICCQGRVATDNPRAVRAGISQESYWGFRTSQTRAVLLFELECYSNYVGLFTRGGVTASTEVIVVKRHTGVHASVIVCKNTIANQQLAYAA